MADRCQALNNDGRRCMGKATKTDEVHLHSEIYGTKWLKARFCKQCFKQLESDCSFEIQKRSKSNGCT